MTEGVDLVTLQTWLSGLLEGGVPDWEVSPETVAVLRQLYLANNRQEKAGQLELEQLQQVTSEYQAEESRIRGVLARTTGSIVAKLSVSDELFI